MLQYSIPKIKMLRNLSCLKTRFGLPCRWWFIPRDLLHIRLNLVFRQRKLDNIFISGIAYSPTKNIQIFSANYTSVKKRSLQKLYLLHRFKSSWIKHKKLTEFNVTKHCSSLKNTQNLPFGVKINFSCLNFQNCTFVPQFSDQMIHYRVAELRYEYKSRWLKLYLNFSTVTIRPLLVFAPLSPAYDITTYDSEYKLNLGQSIKS